MGDNNKSSKNLLMAIALSRLNVLYLRMKASLSNRTIRYSFLWYPASDLAEMPAVIF